ncbi:hypothetical protein GJAV_G00135220 [Gymnothorax javanicus]|nr:hypothetical protein GJAV_G00135220 [Gymnothorax javanicus]
MLYNALPKLSQQPLRRRSSRILERGQGELIPAVADGTGGSRCSRQSRSEASDQEEHSAVGGAAEQKARSPMVVRVDEGGDKDDEDRLAEGIGFVFRFAVAMGYLALSLNATNLHGDPFLNCFFTAAVEIPGHFLAWFLMRSCLRRLCLFVILFFNGAVLLFILLIPKDLSSVLTALEMSGKFGVSAAYSIMYAYTAEVYPTILRNTAMGTCCMAARVGSIIAPYINYMGALRKSLPYIIMGANSILGGLLCLLLPETLGIPLPETIDDMQTIRRCKKRQKSNNLTSDFTVMENVTAF